MVCTALCAVTADELLGDAHQNFCEESNIRLFVNVLPQIRKIGSELIEGQGNSLRDIDKKTIRREGISIFLLMFSFQ